MAANTRVLPKVSQYIKNVGKSTAFLAVDVLGNNSPGIKDFLDTNNEILKQGFSSVIHMRRTIRDVDKRIRQSNIAKAVDVGLKNLIEDAKTGNFYNTTRQAEYSEDILGINDDAYDMEFSSGASKESSSAKILSDSVDKAIGAAAISQNTIVAESTGLMIKSNNANTKLIMSQMDRISAHFTSGMGSVYTAVDRTNQFLNGPMLNHLENSRRYYEETTKLLRDQQMMIKEMLEMQRALYKDKRSEYKESRLGQSMNMSGSINLAGYLKNIKSNFSDFADSRGLSLLNLDMGSGNPYLALAAAPLQSIITLSGIGDRFLPKDFKKSLRSFDKGLTSMFSQVIARLNTAREKDGGLLGVLGELFGIQLDKKNTISTKYNRGAVPFDGITRQAIIETIPGYLARIEAAVTGSGERHYDYRSGTWKSMRQIEKEYARERTDSIASANYRARSELRDLLATVKEQNAKAAEQLSQSIDKMLTQIFDDGGDFRPHRGEGNDAINNPIPAYKYYHFKSQKEFDEVLKYLSPTTLREMAQSNMTARQEYSRKLRDHEENGGPYRHIYNGTYDNEGKGDGTRHSIADFTGGNNLLSLSKDADGHNVFWYLKNILKSISVRHKNATSGGFKYSTKGSRAYRVPTGSSYSRESSTQSESEDGGQDSDIDWDSLFEQRAKEDAEAQKKKSFGDWVSKAFNNSVAGQKIGSMIDGASAIVSTPMEYMTRMLDKADDSMFKLMFGGYEEIKGPDGEPIDNVFSYIIAHVKKSFEEVNNKTKEHLNKIFEGTFKPLWEKYGKPVVDEMKGMFGKAKERVKRTYTRFTEPLANRSRESSGLNDWFRAHGGEAAANYAAERDSFDARMRRGEVVGADEIERAAESARGRIVTKRGLTMISPGEIIIPATFNKKEQDKMLALEKRDKKRIVDAIGLNARGTFSTDELWDNLRTIYEENKGKGAKNAAGGIIGAGAGLLAGFNPLLGAAAGAGLSILSNSNTFKNIVFGKELEDGSREGGFISKKVQDTFKKYAPDITDFGIAGGALGLFTPFGLLGGAAIGAGIGFLKNNETFKKFIFGDENEDGLISKESWKKVKDKVKEAAPNIGIGAVGGALLGPFGLLGNLTMGAGLGLLSTTDSFKKFVFGDKDNPGKGSLVGAIQRGILDPAKERIAKIIDDLRSYAKKNILEPMKNFFKPLTQAIKNIFSSTAERVGDFLNNMFEKTLGIPIHDFLQEKIFKPITKTVFGVLNAPLAVGKAIVAAPFRALGGVDNSIRMRQIKRGTAYDMSASERLEFRKKHGFRKFMGDITGRDVMQEQDEMLANMSEEQLEALVSRSKENLKFGSSLQQQTGAAREAVGNEISAFLNSKDGDGKLRYDKVKFFQMRNKFARMAAEGDYEGAEKWLNNNTGGLFREGLSDQEKADLMSRIKDKVSHAYDANQRNKTGRGAESELDKEISELLDKKFKGPKDIRSLKKQAEAELKHRRRGKGGAEEAADTGSPEAQATNTLTDLYREKADTIISKFDQTNELLRSVLYPDSNKSKKKRAGTVGKYAKNAAGKWYDTTTGKYVSSSVVDAETQASSGVDEVALLNEDTKEATEERQKENKLAQSEVVEAEEATKTNSILSNIKDRLFGSKDGKDKKGYGILSKIGSGFTAMGSGFGKLLKFLGVGGKIALAAGGVSLLGHASEWFKTSVWPTLRDGLIGKQNPDGTVEGGLLGGFINWYKGKGGISGILVNNVMPTLISGWGLAAENVITPVIAMTLKHLPSILWDTGKAIVKGIWGAIFNKEYKRNTISSSAASNELAAMHASTTSSLSAALGANGGKIQSTFGSTGSAFRPMTVNASVDGIGGRESDNYETSISPMGLFGRQRRTNEIEYDENGNIITEYARDNTKDSLASKLVGAGGFAARNTFAGHGIPSVIQKLATKMGKTSLKIKSHKGPIGRIYNVIKRTAKGATKAAGKSITGGAALGEAARNATLNEASGLNDWFRTHGGEYAANLAEERNIANGVTSPKGFFGKLKNKFSNIAEGAAKAGGEFAEKAADPNAGIIKKGANGAKKILAKSKESLAKAGVKVVDKVADNGIVSGIKKIFNSLATSKFATTLMKYVGPLVGTEMTQKYTEGLIKKLGTELAESAGKKLVKNAATSVLKAIGKFSPLSIAFFIADFVSGYRNAYTIFGVPKGGDYNLNIGQKCLAGLLSLITNNITMGLIPADTIIDIILKVFPFMGSEELMKARSEENINSVLDEWNKEHPEETYDNLEDFNKKDTFWSKAKRAVKSWFGKGKSSNNDVTKTSKNGKGKSYFDSNEQFKTYVNKQKKNGYGKISQLDPSIAGMSYNGHTIGQAGCGPVAATNLINSINGNQISVQDAARFATSRGFKPKNDGTDPRYMSSILSASGIANKSVSGRSEISKNLKNGNPVVMMGKGRSRKSPYGNDNPHYITAMGYDRNGNIIVDDPYESGYRAYKESEVMDGVINSVAASRHRGRRRGFGKFGFGMDSVLKNKVISKLYEISNAAEGAYDSVNPNDNGSWSVGIAQFHGEKLKRLFTDIASRFPANSSAYNEATSWAATSGRALSETEAAKVKKFLQDNSELVKEVQHEHMMEVVSNNIVAPLRMYDAGILKDYRSVILAGDIGNTGPAHLVNWEKKYKATTQDKELAHVRDSLKSSDSWWGQQTKNQYYKGWMNRIDNTYNQLSNWNADNYTPIANFAGGGGTQNEGGSNALLDAFKSLGESYVKNLYGEDAFNALYGDKSNQGGSTPIDAPSGTVERFVQTALNEDGYVEKASDSELDKKSANAGSNNYTKYGKYYGSTGPNWPWCAQFVSWAADQSEIPTASMTRSASVSSLKDNFVKNNRFYSRDGYTPKRGDVVMFGSNGGSHVGIVTGIKDGQVKTIEGNTSNKVAQRSYAPTDSYIYGYGDLGLGAGDGDTGLDGSTGTTNASAYGKGGYGKAATGSATSALMAKRQYANETVSRPAYTTQPQSNAVDYQTFLQTIVSVLMNIDNNTALLSKVLEILSDKFDIKIDKSDISAAASKTKAQTEASLKELVQRSSGNNVNVSKLLNNKGTDYILAAMKALATE